MTAILRTFIGLGSILSFATVSQAGVLFGTSFEASEGYHTGVIGGQNGWLGHSTGVIDNTTAGDGTQSLSSADHFSNGTFGNPGLPLWTDTGDARTLVITFQGRFDQRWLDLAPTKCHAMEAELYFSAFSLYPQIRFGVIAESGKTRLHVDAIGSDYSGGREDADVDLQADRWYQFTMVYDMLSGTIGLGLDDKLVSRFDTTPNPPGYQNLTTIGFNSYYNNFDNGYDAQGKAWVDSFVVATLPKPVPEPTALAGLSLGSLLILRKRKRA